MPKNPEREGSPRLITIAQIAEEHGVSRSSVHTYRRSATFPRPVPAEGSTRIRYRADEVAAWFAANPPQQGKRTDLAPEPEQGEPPVTTTTDPRIAVLSDLSRPSWHPTPEAYGMPWDEAVQLLDAYRAAVVTEVVDALRAKAGELSAEAEEEMRRDLEEEAQVWHEAAEMAAKLKSAKAEASDG